VTDHAVLIAASELLPALKARLAPEVRDLLAFTDVEALRALEVITTRRPALVLLERKFAGTPRGAALINRIKADPSLVDSEIRVVPVDGSDAEEAPARPTPPVRAAHPPRPAAAQTAPQLDYRGTRRAPRFRIAEPKDIMVDGNRGTLVDVSTLGLQLVTTAILKPNQRVRVSLTDDESTIRCSATVVWASFEIPKGSGPRYRAGLDFIEPDTVAVDGYIRRHSQG
jgi:hypothetical protein